MIFHSIDSNHRYLSNVVIFTAIYWTFEEWKACLVQDIENCFSYCFHKKALYGAQVARMQNDVIDNEERNERHHETQYARAGFENILIPEYEDGIIQELMLKDLSLDITTIISTTVRHNLRGDSGDESEEDETEITEKHLKGLSVPKALL